MGRNDQNIFNRLDMQELLDRVPEVEYLATPDVAELFEVHEVTVYRWVGTRELLPVNPRRRRHGKVHRFKRETVLEFIRKRYEPAQIGGGGDDDQD